MQKPTGAGGTEGGIGRFFVGVIMLVVGGYLFLNNIRVDHSLQFGLGFRLMSVRGFSITSGYVLIPFVFGIGMIFYNAKNYVGWFLTIASLAMLGFGVITSVQLTLRHMTAFELISILVLTIGGLGIFLSSLKTFTRKLEEVSE